MISEADRKKLQEAGFAWIRNAWRHEDGRHYPSSAVALYQIDEKNNPPQTEQETDDNKKADEQKDLQENIQVAILKALQGLTDSVAALSKTKVAAPVASVPLRLPDCPSDRTQIKAWVQLVEDVINASSSNDDQTRIALILGRLPPKIAERLTDQDRSTYSRLLEALTNLHSGSPDSARQRIKQLRLSKFASAEALFQEVNLLYRMAYPNIHKEALRVLIGDSVRDLLPPSARHATASIERDNLEEMERIIDNCRVFNQEDQITRAETNFLGKKPQMQSSVPLCRHHPNCEKRTSGCQYRHPGTDEMCRNYTITGKCRFLGKCRYKHNPNEAVYKTTKPESNAMGLTKPLPTTVTAQVNRKNITNTLLDTGSNVTLLKEPPGTENYEQTWQTTEIRTVGGIVNAIGPLETTIGIKDLNIPEVTVECYIYGNLLRNAILGTDYMDKAGIGLRQCTTKIAATAASNRPVLMDIAGLKLVGGDQQRPTLIGKPELNEIADANLPRERVHNQAKSQAEDIRQLVDQGVNEGKLTWQKEPPQLGPGGNTYKHTPPRKRPRLIYPFQKVNQWFLSHQEQWPKSETSTEAAMKVITRNEKIATMDLKDAYMQIEINDTLAKILTVRAPTTAKNQPEWVRPERVPYGWCAAPLVMEFLLKSAFKHLSPDRIAFYVDDIVVGGQTEDELANIIEDTMKALNQFHLRIKPVETKFPLEFLGRQLTATELAWSEERWSEMRASIMSLQRTKNQDMLTNRKVMAGVAEIYCKELCPAVLWCILSKIKSSCAKGAKQGWDKPPPQEVEMLLQEAATLIEEAGPQKIKRNIRLNEQIIAYADASQLAAAVRIEQDNQLIAEEVTMFSKEERVASHINEKEALALQRAAELLAKINRRVTKMPHITIKCDSSVRDPITL